VRTTTRRQFLAAAGAAAMSGLLSGDRWRRGLRPARPPASLSGYGFADEFGGPAGTPPDPARWLHELADPGWVNNELQVYTDDPANACLDGRGHLAITATRTGSGYASARLTTEGLFSQPGGSWQARIRLDSRPGCWPAFWLLGADIGQAGWPACGEIDIMEDYGKSWIQATVHTAGGHPDAAVRAGLTSDRGWHVYQLDCSGNRMDFFRDGQPFLTATAGQFPAGSWPYGRNGGMFALLNLAVGGDEPGAPPPGARFPVTMLVDYVRAWAS
jgi:beta-glucanase (GH16 family)